ncbi:unnamed protein product [Closterium sp. Naga37s-1]|nr:unnamed protein product [Closterium sp. Naga37s-1]
MGRLLNFVPTVAARAAEWVLRRLPPELFSTSLIEDYPGHNSTVQQALESLVVWDSVFFHRIALCGYEFEQAYAFFPLLPLLMRLLATATPFRLLLPILGAPATFALVGLLLSNATFIAAAYCLFRLTECVLSDSRLALLSSLFFCPTPASTFYSAIYSESLFALLSFAAMWRVVSGRWFSASLLIALSAAVRSNGVLHAGFFLFSLLQVRASSESAGMFLFSSPSQQQLTPTASCTQSSSSLPHCRYTIISSLPPSLFASLQLASVHSLPHNLPQPNTELTGSALAPLPLPPCLRLSFNQQFPHPTSVAVAAAGPFILPLLPFQLLQRLINAVKKQGSEPREQHPPHKSSEKRAERRVAATERAADRIGPLLERKRQLCRKRLLPILLSTALCCLLSFSLLLSFQFFPFTQFCRPAASTRTSPASETPHDIPPWCLDSVPYIYGYVQRKYCSSALLLAPERLETPPPGA